jgi:hypothetical protein
MLSVYLQPGQPFVLNHLIGENTIDSWDAIADATCVDPTLFSIDELTTLRARLFRHANLTAHSTRFVKTHLANLECADGGRLFGPQTGRAVYIVRNPFDVAVSYSHYVALPVREITELMTKGEIVLDRPGAGRPRIPPQPMGSWRQHVISWCERPDFPVLLLRYEDMHADAAAALAEVVRFAGLPWSADAIQQSVEATRFETLRNLEALQGFREKTPLAQHFFRNGTVGAGKADLPDECVRCLDELLEAPLDRLQYGRSTPVELG